jgi:Na+-driven multidrug efflux pump
MRAFSNDPEIIAVGAVYLFIMGLLQIPQNLAGLLNGALRGAGYPKASMVNVGVGLWIVRVPLVLFMTYVMDAGIEWIWLMMGVDLLVRFILAIFTYRRKDIFNSTKEAVGSVLL